MHYINYFSSINKRLIFPDILLYLASLDGIFSCLDTCKLKNQEKNRVCNFLDLDIVKTRSGVFGSETLYYFYSITSI